MSDTFYGQIEIGGKIKKDLVPELIEVLSGELCDTGGDSVKDQVEAAIIGHSSLEFTESDARWGRFEDTEEFCKKHGLEFEIEVGNYYDSEAYIVRYEGAGEERQVRTDHGHARVLHKGELKQFIIDAKHLCENPEKIPLLINEEKKYLPEVIIAKEMAKTGLKEPMEVIEHIIEVLSPEFSQVPPLETY